MRTDDDVDFSGGQVFRNLFQFLGRPQAADVIHADRKIFQAVLERMEMLQGEDGGGHQHRNLLSVARRLESGPHRHFGLAEAHVAADQPIHGMDAFHIGLDRFGGCCLVGRIFEQEGRFQLLLHIVVRRKGKAARLLTLAVEFDEVFGDILDFRFSTALEILPGLAAELIDFWRFAVPRLELGNAMQGMDRNEHHVAARIDELDGLLHAPALDTFHQTAVLPHPVIDVNHVIAHPQRIQVADGHLLGTLHLAVDVKLVVALENLVVGIITVFRPLVDIAFMQ